MHYLAIRGREDRHSRHHRPASGGYRTSAGVDAEWKPYVDVVAAVGALVGIMREHSTAVDAAAVVVVVVVG